MKKKVTASRALYVSHMEAVQNVVRLHKASSNACLDEISALTSSNAQSIEDVGCIGFSDLALQYQFLCFFILIKIFSIVNFIKIWFIKYNICF